MYLLALDFLNHLVLTPLVSGLNLWAIYKFITVCRIMALIQFKKLYTIDGAPFRLLSSEEKILLDNSFCFPEPHTYIPGLPLLKKNQKEKKSNSNHSKK